MPPSDEESVSIPRRDVDCYCAVSFHVATVGGIVCGHLVLRAQRADPKLFVNKSWGPAGELTPALARSFP